MRHCKTEMILTVITALTLIPAMALAFAGDTKGSHDRKPPVEAIKACEGRKAGAKVQFQTPRGEKVDATCAEIQGQLAAVPDGRPPHGGRQAGQPLR